MRTKRDWKNELIEVEKRDGAEILSLNGNPFGELSRDSIKVRREDKCQYRACCGSVEERTVRLIVERVGMLSTEQIKFNKQQKIKATNLEKYGCECSLQSQGVKDKRTATNLEKYGCENPAQSQGIKDKRKATCLKNNGCEHPMHNAEIFEKQQKNSYRRKFYTFRDDTTVEVQGYEDQALKLLEERHQYASADFIQGKERLKKTFPYCDNGKNRVYHPDIPTPNKGLLRKGWIEVKCNYTFQNGMEKNCEIIKKGKAVIESGYHFEIWVFKTNKDTEPVKISSENGVDRFKDRCMEYYNELI